MGNLGDTREPRKWAGNTAEGGVRAACGSGFPCLDGAPADIEAAHLLSQCTFLWSPTELNERAFIDPICQFHGS